MSAAIQDRPDLGTVPRHWRPYSLSLVYGYVVIVSDQHAGTRGVRAHRVPAHGDYWGGDLDPAHVVNCLQYWHPIARELTPADVAVYETCEDATGAWTRYQSGPDCALSQYDLIAVAPLAQIPDRTTTPPAVPPKGT